MAFVIKQLFQLRLLEMGRLEPTWRYAPRWLSNISYPKRARGINRKLKQRRRRRRGQRPVKKKIEFIFYKRNS